MKYFYRTQTEKTLVRMKEILAEKGVKEYNLIELDGLLYEIWVEEKDIEKFKGWCSLAKWKPLPNYMYEPSRRTIDLIS